MKCNWLLALCALTWGGGGCAAPQEQIVETAAGRRAAPEEVDRDPWRLLPGGAVTWGRLDVQAANEAVFAKELQTWFEHSLPVSGKLGIDFAQDVDEVVLGLYATAGSDVAAVARGRFEERALKEAIEQEPVNAGQRPIVTHRFAGQQVYVSGSWALAPITSATIVFGTEIGVRRVLERIEEGRLARVLPAWFEQMLEVKEASMVVGVDLDAQPVPSVLRTRLAFLDGLRAGRFLWNFQEPGLNGAGTLTYDTPASAQKAASGLGELSETLRRSELLLTLFQIPRPFRRLEAQATDKDTQVVVEIDGRAIQALFASDRNWLDEFLLSTDGQASLPSPGSDAQSVRQERTGGARDSLSLNGGAPRAELRAPFPG